MSDFASQELVTVFASEARRAFGFCEAAFDCAAELEVQVHTEHGLRPVDLPEVEEGGYFLAALTYTGDRLRVEITYGDREFALGVRVGRTVGDALPNMYGLDEWGEAIGVDSAGATRYRWLTSVERVRDAVDRTAAEVYQLLADVLAADPTTMDRLAAVRAERRRAHTDALAEHEHRRAAALAAAAFREQDYGTVVRLLSGVEARLTPSERKTLEFARRQVG